MPVHGVHPSGTWPRLTYGVVQSNEEEVPASEGASASQSQVTIGSYLGAAIGPMTSSAGVNLGLSTEGEMVCHDWLESRVPDAANQRP